MWIEILPFAIMSMPAVRPIPLPVQWVLQFSSHGVERLECSADNSPLPSAEIKNVWSHTYAHPSARQKRKIFSI